MILIENGNGTVIQKRNKIVHIAFAMEEKEIIKRHTKNCNMTISEFIR